MSEARRQVREALASALSEATTLLEAKRIRQAADVLLTTADLLLRTAEPVPMLEQTLRWPLERASQATDLEAAALLSEATRRALSQLST